MTKYTSEIYTVNATQAQAYERLADLRRFEALKAAFSDPEKMQYILQNLPADQVSPEKLAEIREQVEKMQFTEDTISADTKMGPVSLAIVERETRDAEFSRECYGLGATRGERHLPSGT